MVVGDLNSTYPLKKEGVEEATALSHLLDSGLFKTFPDTANQADHYTFPSINPDRVIDWILFPPSWRVITGSVEKNRMSDHLLVAVSLSRE